MVQENTKTHEAEKNSGLQKFVDILSEITESYLKLLDKEEQKIEEDDEVVCECEDKQCCKHNCEQVEDIIEDEQVEEAETKSSYKQSSCLYFSQNFCDDAKANMDLMSEKLDDLIFANTLIQLENEEQTSEVTFVFNDVSFAFNWDREKETFVGTSGCSEEDENPTLLQYDQYNKKFKVIEDVEEEEYEVVKEEVEDEQEFSKDMKEIEEQIASEEKEKYIAPTIQVSEELVENTTAKVLMDNLKLVYANDEYYRALISDGISKIINTHDYIYIDDGFSDSELPYGLTFEYSQLTSYDDRFANLWSRVSFNKFAAIIKEVFGFSEVYYHGDLFKNPYVLSVVCIF